VLVRTTVVAATGASGKQLFYWFDSAGVLAATTAAAVANGRQPDGLERRRGLRIREARLGRGCAYARVIRVEIVSLSFSQVVAELVRAGRDEALREGRVGRRILRRPYDTSGLRLHPVGSEQRSSAVPATTAWASRVG